MPLRGRTPVRTAPHPVHLCTHAQAADPCAPTPRLTHRHTHAHTESQTPWVSHSHPHGGSRRVTWPHCHSITAMLGARAHTCSHALTRSWIQAHGSHTAVHLITRCPRPVAHTLHQSCQRSAGPPPTCYWGRPGQGDTRPLILVWKIRQALRRVCVCRALTSGPGPRREESPKVIVANFP